MKTKKRRHRTTQGKKERKKERKRKRERERILLTFLVRRSPRLSSPYSKMKVGGLSFVAYRFGLNPPVPPPIPAPDPPPKAPPTLALGRYMKKTPYANETKIQHSLTHTNTKLPRSETALYILERQVLSSKGRRRSTTQWSQQQQRYLPSKCSRSSVEAEKASLTDGWWLIHEKSQR